MNHEDIPASGASNALVGPPPAVLTGRNRAVIDALVRKSDRCELAIGMYMEALRALARADGPEAIHVAAYELREFMNTLPRVFNVPVVDHVQLVGRVQSFAQDWARSRAKTSCYQDGRWEGEIDGRLRSMLHSAETFIAWRDEYVPTRREQTSVLLQRLAPTEYPSPPALVDRRTSEWAALLRYFNGCAHHDDFRTADEFRRRADQLDVFLLEYLEPRTVDDQAEIDRLVEEAEG